MMLFILGAIKTGRRKLSGQSRLGAEPQPGTKAQLRPSLLSPPLKGHRTCGADLPTTIVMTAIIGDPSGCGWM